VLCHWALSVTLVVVLAATRRNWTTDLRRSGSTPGPQRLSLALHRHRRPILWYRLPVRPFHKRVLLSYLPYLLIFTVAMNALRRPAGSEDGSSYFNQIAYLTLAAWAWAAWQPVDQTEGRSPVSACRCRAQTDHFRTFRPST
jgi:hypothetical protein